MFEISSGPTIQQVSAFVIVLVVALIIWRLFVDDKLKRRRVDADRSLPSEQLDAWNKMNSENAKLFRQMLDELKAIRSLLEKSN